MRFQVLGPLEVEADDGPVQLGGPKERLLLALLLTRPNQVVSVEALQQGLWGDRPPPSAAKTLQSHVKRLRQTLEPGRARGAAGQVLVTRQPGYLLRVERGALDAARFEELTAKARRLLSGGEADAAGSMLREALGLWRGQAFLEFLDTDFAAAEADRLGELRLVAVEDRIEAELRLGRHRELVAELERLVREQPLRERLWAQLLLALYRSGRQADALLAYQRARSVLVEELGIDPGTELRRVHAAILAQDPGLDLPVMVEAAGARELPDPLNGAGPPFVGRAAELAWLRAAWTRAIQGRGGVVFLEGGPGMGKTRLAAELAREVHNQGGRVLYGQCVARPRDLLQPFEQALAGAGASLGDVPAAASAPGKAPAGRGQVLTGLLARWPDLAVLMVLDDLHRATASTLEAFAELAAAAATQRLLIVGAYRDEVGADGFTELIQRLDPDRTGRRRLGPFHRVEVAQVLALYQGEQAAQAAADVVLERTGGAPLLVYREAGDRAKAQAAQLVEETARQTADSRSHLHLIQTRLADDVVDLRELGEHTEQVAGLANGSGSPIEEADDRPAAAVCPYKGLARFEPDDAEFFFGRERLVAELVTHLVGTGLIGVVGPSGSGKSSLVRAGLLPALADGVLPGSERWRQVIVRPGEHPMTELAHAAARADETAGRDASGDSRDADDDIVPGQAAEEWRPTSGALDRLLLVVDQFEEVFTACRDEAERTAFLAALTGADRADSPVTVVIAVRADYYGHCAADPRLAGLLAANHVLVGPMNTDELHRAVELPARRAGLRLEPGLAEAMVGEVTDEPGGLPLLSCALLESWQRRQGRTLTLAAYHQAGGVRGAVARLAERAWHRLNPDQRAVARRILLRLAGPGEGEAVVRRRVPLDEFTTGHDEGVQAVLETLTDHRLLTRSQGTVEVAHEALLREWPRLRGWLEEDVQGRVLHRHLGGAASGWQAVGRDPGELYRGARLTAALDWAHAHDADLNQLEREYLDASRANAEREVDDARRRAEQEAGRARREARISRRLRAALAGLAVVLVLALVAGGLALTLRGRAEHQALVADSRRLGAQALLEDELDRSLLLARQAVALDDSLETRSDLLVALLRSPAASAILRGDLDGIGALNLSPDGQLLAVGDGDGTVAIFDLRTRRLIREWSSQGHEQVNDLAFSPDGSLLAASTNGPSDPVYLWDVRGAGGPRKLSRRGAADARDLVYGIEFSADGQTLVTLSIQDSPDPGRGAAFLTRWEVGGGRRRTGPVRVSSHGGDALLAARDGRLVVVNGAEVLVAAADTLRPLRPFPHPLAQPRFFVAALSPRDGRTLALWSDDGPIQFLNLDSGRRRAVGRHEGGVGSIRFSSDGKTLATGGYDRTVKVWDVASRQLRETFQGHEARVLGLGFSRDGHTLYSSGSKSVIAWDLQGDGRLGRPFSMVAGSAPYRGSLSPSEALAVSSDGALLAAPVASAPDQVAVLDLHSPRQVRRPLAPGVGTISAMAFSRDGRQLAVAGDHASGPVVIDLTSGEVRQRMTGGHRGGVNAIAFDPGGRRLVTGGTEDQDAIVWNVETGEPIRHLQHPANGTPEAVTVRWSPDGSMVATAGAQGKVTLWSASDWRQLATLTADTRAILAVAFSPDGSRIAATGGGDRAVTLWDVATHKRVGRLPHPIFILAMAFDPRGHTLATSAADGKVRLWDVATMRQIGQGLPGPEGRANVAAFDSSGTHLIAIYDTDTAVLWNMDPDRWKQHACTVAGRSLTKEEWKELLPSRRYQPACR